MSDSKISNLSQDTSPASADKFVMVDNANSSTEYIEFSDVETNLDHDSLSNFVSNEHIDHSNVSISAGTGLSGGGDLTSSRTLSLNASLSNLSDVGTTAATDGHIIASDGTDFDSESITSVTEAHVNLSDLKDVNTTVGNSQLTNSSVTVAGNSISLGGSSSINHSDLSNIGSSDHHSKTSSASELTDVSADSVSDAHHTRPTAGIAINDNSNTFDFDGASVAGDNITWDSNNNELDASVSASGVTIEEEDGSPSVAGVTEINVTNGTLTDNGGGSVSLDTGGGGGGSTDEEIQDAVYNNVLSGTQTLINVTYNDANNEVDYTVDNDLSNYDNSTSGFISDISGENLTDLSDVDTDKLQTPSDGDVLTYDGTDWQAEAPSGGIGGSTGSTDNALLRADGTGGSTLQNTGITVDDTDNVGNVASISPGPDYSQLDFEDNGGDVSWYYNDTGVYINDSLTVSSGLDLNNSTIFDINKFAFDSTASNITTSFTGTDTSIVTGTSGTSQNLIEWNADGDAVDAGVATDDVVTPSSTDILTNKTIDADGTGNSVSNIGANETKLGDGLEGDGSDNIKTSEMFPFTIPTDQWAAGLSNAEIGRKVLQSGETLVIDRIELHEDGGGTSNANMSVRVQDVTASTTIGSTDLNTVTKNPGSSGTANTIAIQITNSTGSQVNANVEVTGRVTGA